jgi:hypothetical protein
MLIKDPNANVETDGTALWDGDESVLPGHLRSILLSTDEVEADRIRERLKTLTLDEIEITFPGAPPISPFVPGPPPSLDDYWAALKDEVRHIADMFQTLAEAGMPAEMAMSVIRERLSPHGAAPAFNTAGTRVEGVYSAHNVRLGQHFGSTIVPPPFGNGSR